MTIIYYKAETEEKANKLFDILNRAGYKWNSGDSLKDFNNWSKYGEDTCYLINPISKLICFDDCKRANKSLFRKTLKCIGL